MPTDASAEVFSDGSGARTLVFEAAHNGDRFDPVVANDLAAFDPHPPAFVYARSAYEAFELLLDRRTFGSADVLREILVDHLQLERVVLSHTGRTP